MVADVRVVGRLVVGRLAAELPAKGVHVDTAPFHEPRRRDDVVEEAHFEFAGWRFVFATPAGLPVFGAREIACRDDLAVLFRFVLDERAFAVAAVEPTRAVRVAMLPSLVSAACRRLRDRRYHRHEAISGIEKAAEIEPAVLCVAELRPGDFLVRRGEGSALRQQAADQHRRATHGRALS